jgi:hypothetical protein
MRDQYNIQRNVLPIPDPAIAEDAVSVGHLVLREEAARVARSRP